MRAFIVVVYLCELNFSVISFKNITSFLLYYFSNVAYKLAPCIPQHSLKILLYSYLIFVMFECGEVINAVICIWYTNQGTIKPVAHAEEYHQTTVQRYGFIKDELYKVHALDYTKWIV